MSARWIGVEMIDWLFILGVEYNSEEWFDNLRKRRMVNMNLRL